MHLADWLSLPARVVVLLCVLPTTASAAPQVWSGLVKSFTKPAFANPLLPENQDYITANVALTRADTLGMFNAVSEVFFVGNVSPADTLWATDLNNPPGTTIAAANWENLSFEVWVDAYGGFQMAGQNIENRDAVVFLVSDDVVLDLRFTEWGRQFGGGGSFSYLRAVPEPTTAALLLAAGLWKLVGRNRRRR